MEISSGTSAGAAGLACPKRGMRAGGVGELVTMFLASLKPKFNGGALDAEPVRTHRSLSSE